MSSASYTLGSEPLQLVSPGAFSPVSSQVAQIMEFQAIDVNASVVLPPVLTGLASITVWRNQVTSSFSMAVLNGSTISAIIAPGETYVGYALNTQNGGVASVIWSMVKIAGQNFNVTAPALAGYGLLPMENGTLSLNAPVTQVAPTSTYYVTWADAFSVLVVQSGTPGIVMTSAMFSGFSVTVSLMVGAGPCAITCQVDGMTINGVSSLTLMAGNSCTLVSDGSNFWVGSQSVNPAFSVLSPVLQTAITPGQTSITLTPLNLLSGVLSFNTSPQNGGNAFLTANCTVWMGSVAGAWDVTFLTVSNGQGCNIIFSAGTPSAASTGPSVQFSGNQSFGARIAVQTDPSGQVYGVYQIGAPPPVT